MKLRKAFTLIELIIVLAIIGVLLVALLPAVTGAPAKGRDAARITGANEIAQAVESIAARTGSYPTQTFADAADCLDPTAAGIGLDIKNELKKFPTVGKAGTEVCSAATEQFFYKTLTTNGSYLIAVQLERVDQANVVADVTGATVREWTDGNIAIEHSDRDPVDTAAPYVYVLVK